MDDEQISVHCYQKDGEGGEEDTSGLNTSNQLAHYFLQKIIMEGIVGDGYQVRAECPVLGDDVHEGERHGEGAEQKVREGEDGNEGVSCGLENL